MYTLIRYPVGIIVEAVVLFNRKNRMRVAAAGFPDAIEFRRSGTQWVTENREPVEFDFLLSNSHPGASVSQSGTASIARAMSAPGQY